MKTIVEIQSVADYYDLVEKTPKCIVLFSADWCGDCLFLKQFLDQLVSENQEYQWYYVDRDKLLDICIENGIMGIPSFIAYKEGKKAGTFISKQRKTKQEVQDFINSLGE